MSSGAAAVPLVIEIILFLACAESTAAEAGSWPGEQEQSPAPQALYAVGRMAANLDLDADLLYSIWVNIS